jgi:sugar phosphate isomerase/epimerase
MLPLFPDALIKWFDLTSTGKSAIQETACPAMSLSRKSSKRYYDAEMITRRKFAQLSLSALPAFASRTLWAQKHIPLGVQLYTLRELAQKNLPSVLKQIRAIGYQEVELIPLAYTNPPKELSRIVADSGLTAPSGHFNYEGFGSKFEYAKALGLQWMVCPMLPGSLGKSIDGFHRAARQLNAWGKQAREFGLRVAFHNHDYEFRKWNEGTGFDVLKNETDPELVFFEMDCYWVAQAGLDPVLFLNQLGKRVRLLHLKDRKPGFPPSTDTDTASAHFTEVGKGEIRWRNILILAQKLEVEHYFVEQDRTEGSPLESIRISYEYLRNILP